MQIIGSFVSPYVRKVLACLEIKGIAYEVDPITPFFGNDAFRRLSPLRRIPVLIDGDLVLTDSTVIAEYIEERFPDPPLLPSDPQYRARARWLEEYADSRLGDVFIWGLFYPKFVHPNVWKEPGDQQRIERSLTTDIPMTLDYLETQLPAQAYLFGEHISLADIAVASFFRNAAYVDFHPDPDRWPRVAGFVGRVLTHPAFETLHCYEKIQLSTSIAGRRQALLDAGARLTEVSFGQREPRRGIMRL